MKACGTFDRRLQTVCRPATGTRVAVVLAVHSYGLTGVVSLLRRYSVQRDY